MTILLTALIIILGILAASLPSFYEVITKVRGKKKLTKAGQVVLLLISIFTLLQILQAFMVENEKNETIKQQVVKDSIAKRDEFIKDSLHQAFIVNNNKSIVNPFAEGFSKYGLKYDSATKVIEKLVRDSAKRESKFYSMGRPILDLREILLTKLTNDSAEFQVKIACEQSTAYNVNLPLKYGCIDKSSYVYNLGTLKEKPAAGDLTAGKVRTIHLKIPRMDNAEIFLFYIKGSYTDIPKLDSQYPFYAFYQYDVKTKIMTMVSEKNKEMINVFTL